MTTVFIATGPRKGQYIRGDAASGVLPDLIAFPDPLEGNGNAGEGVRVLAPVDPGTPGSTTYKAVVKGGADCPPMYYEVVD
jgi:hypothetical protein